MPQSKAAETRAIFRPGPAAGVLRLGIIGFGNIGRQHLKAANECDDLSVVAIADSHFGDEAVPRGIAQYRRWQELLARAEVEAVSLCVPHHLHAPMALAALEAGKHVLVEKPLALNCVEGETLIQAAKTFDRTLMVEMTHRFYPPLIAAREMVQSHKIGQLYAVQDRIVEPVGAQLPPWMQERATAGGGVAITNAIHMLDRIAFVAGDELVFENGRAGYEARLGDIEDTAAMQLRLRQSGVPVQLLASWPRGEVDGDDELTLFGSAAILRVWAWRGWRLEPLNGKTPPQENFCYPPHHDITARVRRGVRGALEEFAAAIRARRAPQPNAGDALKAQRLVEEFYASQILADA